MLIKTSSAPAVSIHFPTVPLPRFSRGSQALVMLASNAGPPRSVPGLSGWFLKRSAPSRLNFVVCLDLLVSFDVFFAVQIWRDSETKRMVLAFFNWTTYWKHLCSQGVAGWFTRTGASSGPISVVLWLPLSKIQVLGRGSVACTECWSLMNIHPMKISIPKFVVNHHWFPIFFMWLWGFEWFEGPDFLLRIATLRSPSSGKNSQDGSFAGDIVAWNWRFHHLS